MTEEIFTGIYGVTVVIAFLFLSWDERRDSTPSSKPVIDDADFYMVLLFAVCWPLVVLTLLFFVTIDKWKMWISNGR